MTELSKRVRVATGATATTPDWHAALTACDYAFGSITLCLSAYAGWLAIHDRVSALLAWLTLAVPVFNVAWSFVARGLGHVQLELIRLVINVPLVTSIYLLGEDNLSRLLIPIECVAVGSGVVFGVYTRRLSLATLGTVVYATALVASSHLFNVENIALSYTHAVELLLMGLIVSIMSAYLGRSAESERERRAEAERQHARAENALAQLAATQAQLIDTARRAGMADISSGVLHNVGNVLTSVKVATNSIEEAVVSMPRLSRLVAQLQGQADLSTFLSGPKGRMLPEYLAKLAEAMEQNIDRTKRDIEGLRANVEHICHLVSSQQEHARPIRQLDSVDLSELIDHAVQIEADALHREGVEVRTILADVGDVHTDRHHLLQIVVNLLRNARQALGRSNRADPRVEVEVLRRDQHTVIEVRDNGPGIEPEVMDKLFHHGFTTRPDGHGVGLHMSSLSAKHLGGSLRAESEGRDRGATFIISLPDAPVAAAVERETAAVE